MKKLYAYFNEKGQDLVEYTLILAFCAVMVTTLNSDTFHRAIKAIFDRGVFNDVSTYVSGGDYKDALEAFGQDSRRALINIKYKYGRYYHDTSSPDPVDNNSRIAADKTALENIGKYLVNMDLETVAKLMFGDTYAIGKNNVYFNTDKNGNYITGTYGKEILILNYTDSADVEDNYDPYTQTYRTVSNHSTVNTSIANGGRAFAADEVIHWMQEDYGFKGFDENGKAIKEYDSTLNFNSNKRYFFSNEMIDPDSSLSGGTLKRNIRVNFEVDSEGNIVKVLVRAQRNGEDIDSLQVVVER